MTSTKCFFCHTPVSNPVQLTEISEDGSIYHYDVCDKCSQSYMGNLPDSVKNSPSLDLSHIKSPEDLLSLLSQVQTGQNIVVPPCECGLTDKDFEKFGRFGCPKCYKHFNYEMEQLVFPFHKAHNHVGKKPKRGYLETLMQNPVEKMKILKLRYAKALELEDYENASKIKIEMDSEQVP